MEALPIELIDQILNRLVIDNISLTIYGMTNKNIYIMICKYAENCNCERLHNDHICLYAATNGYLKILKWARINGCIWESNVCLYAAFNGHSETLKWARENGCTWDSYVCVYAALNGYLNIIKWAIENE
jgi:hypothetical protein